MNLILPRDYVGFITRELDLEGILQVLPEELYYLSIIQFTPRGPT